MSLGNNYMFYHKSCGATSGQILPLLANLSLTLTEFFPSPAINILFLPPHFSHSFVSVDAQVSLTFPNPHWCGRIKYMWFTIISNKCILILNFYFIGSLGNLFIFKFLSPNKHIMKEASFLVFFSCLS